MNFLSRKKLSFAEIIPKGYVDIHSHLLANVDDGVETVYQSAYIIEQLTAIGVTKIITTPHVMQEVWPNTTHDLQNKLERMRAVLHALKIQVDLETSAEYMLDDLFYERLQAKDILPLPKSHILVEMSTFNPPINLKELLFEIKLAGFTPVLAHPERYAFYNTSLKSYTSLKKQGVLFQVNLLSLTGFYGDTVKNMAFKLLNEGFIDFTGSDIHNYKQLEALTEHKFSNKQGIAIQSTMQNNRLFS